MSIIDNAKEIVSLVQKLEDIELYRKIVELEGEIIELIREKREIEQQLTQLSDWETEKQRYVLVNPWEGAAVYALKEESKGNDAPHWICTNCYQKNIKSMLNQMDGTRGFTKVVCPVCNAQMQSPFRSQIPANYV